MRNTLRTWIEINRKSLKNNYNIFRRLIGQRCFLMAVVKSNAYGHGLIDFSQAAEKLGVDWLGVDSIVEAESLRRSGLKKPILVLGYTLRDKIEDETILIGKNGKSEISADDLADLSGTINYEIITRLNPLIKRIYQ